MTSQESNNAVPEPWYKQFWPWFLIALPASVVVAGFITLAIAIDRESSLVADDYYKQGLGINRVLAEDKLAETLSLQARMEIDTLTGEVFAEVGGKSGAFSSDSLPRELLLVWIHPTNSEKDQQITLKQVALNQGTSSHYRGQLQTALSGRWYVQLRGDEPEPWRLRSTIYMDSPENIGSNDTVEDTGNGDSAVGMKDTKQWLM